MKSYCFSSLVLLISFCLFPAATSFVAHTKPFIRQYCGIAATRFEIDSEYSLEEEEEEEEQEEGEEEKDFLVVSHPEFAALSPGSVVQIQVGNLDLSRKAWKKRRRSGSPLLIPCSVLNTDRTSMVIGNIVYLVRKFGMPICEQGITDNPIGFRSKDIALAMPDLHRWYKKHLGISLAKHSRALAYDTAADMVRDLMSHPAVEEEFGVKLHTEGKYVWLLTRISQMKGHRLAAQSAMLQFNAESTDEMVHTGMTRVRNTEDLRYSLQPLSAAIRVSQRAIDKGLIENGGILSAAVLGVDPMGDNGLPLLKLSLNIQTTKPRRSRSKRKVSAAAKAEPPNPLEIVHTLDELKPGDGPYVGRIVRMNRRLQSVYIDIGAGRKAKIGHGNTRVLGLLSTHKNSALQSLVDAVAKEEARVDKIAEAVDTFSYDHEDDEEDDIDEGEEGGFDNVADDEEHDDDSDDWIVSGFDLDDLFDEEGEGDREDVSALGGIESDHQQGSQYPPDAKDLRVGDEVTVYIQAISNQSGRFLLTTDPSTKKMREVKKESKANKAMERLIAKFGGDVNNILALRGTECEGVIKATSQTGDWMYVQPQMDDLPVGIASFAVGISGEHLAQGDTVQVRLDGVDESRGQLAMTVIDI